MSANIRRRQVQAAYGSLLRAIEQRATAGAASASLHSVATPVRAPPLRHLPHYNTSHYHPSTTSTYPPCRLASTLFPGGVQSLCSTSFHAQASTPGLQVLRRLIHGQSVGGPSASLVGLTATTRHIGMRSFASTSSPPGRPSGGEDDEARKVSEGVNIECIRWSDTSSLPVSLKL